ncbi:hypothetical protein MKEN_00393600 [Mycena kentingensis (nom. inval.)]|nr:hypothetical protein MKEN_00393600 [Mycena kentingensis (nom. inval.)]
MPTPAAMSFQHSPSAPASTIVELNIAAVIAESVLYGVFLVLFCGGMYVRVVRCETSCRSRLWWSPVVVCTVAIFLIASAHWAIAVARWICTSSAFISGRRHRSVDVLLNVNGALSLSSLWFGDAVIIHRLWVLGNRNAKIAVPAILSWTMLVVCGIILSVGLLRNVPNSPAVIYMHWILRVFTNVYCTLCISWRLWRVRKSHTDQAFETLNTLLAVTIESAAILAAWTIFYVTTSELNSPLNLFAGALTPQVIGLTNMLIQIRIALTSGAGGEGSGSGLVITSLGSMVRVNVVHLGLPELPDSGAGQELKEEEEDVEMTRFDA